MAPAMLAAVLFTLTGMVCLGLVVAGIPGGWILVGVAAVMELTDAAWLGPEATSFGWGWIVSAVVVLGIGEAIEFASGLAGAKAGGASRKGMVGAVAGGFLGAILGTFLLPVPVLGTLVGAFGGTFLGALAGEMSGAEGRTARESMKPALAATAARALGLAAKIGLTVFVWIGLSVAIFGG